jgi:hypothetical protein
MSRKAIETQTVFGSFKEPGPTSHTIPCVTQVSGTAASIQTTWGDLPGKKLKFYKFVFIPDQADGRLGFNFRQV